jgi:hypothetical protein
MSVDVNYEGQPTAIGEHRTVGSHRAWCLDCGEWCYPDEWCDCCHYGAGHQKQWVDAQGKVVTDEEVTMSDKLDNDDTGIYEMTDLTERNTDLTPSEPMVDVEAFWRVWDEEGARPYSGHVSNLLREGMTAEERKQGLKNLLHSDEQAERANDDLARRAVIAALGGPGGRGAASEVD